MTTRRNMGLAALALALACALPGGAPAAAFASDDDGSYVVGIEASVTPDTSVVSVVVPSSVSVVVKTSVVDGRVIGFDAGEAVISNSAESSAPISVSLDAVSDTPNGRDKLLGYVDMAFDAQHRVSVVEGTGQGLPLFDAIGPGESGSIGIGLSQKSADVLVPAGSYAVRATLAVSAVKAGA